MTTGENLSLNLSFQWQSFSNSSISDNTWSSSNSSLKTFGDEFYWHNKNSVLVVIVNKSAILTAFWFVLRNWLRASTWSADGSHQFLNLSFRYRKHWGKLLKFCSLIDKSPYFLTFFWLILINAVHFVDYFLLIHSFHQRKANYHWAVLLYNLFTNSYDMRPVWIVI